METKTYCTANHILVGLGGTGGRILREFKMRMFEEFPTQEERKKQSVAILYVDSTDEMMPKDGRARADFRVMGQDASFDESEFLYIKKVDVEQILEHINNYPSVKGIVSNAKAVKSAIGNLGEAAGQKRRAGRLLFAANANGYVNSLNNAYSRCVKVSGNSSKVNIHIMAGLCGGTGSGAIVDAVVQARKAFGEAIINVYAMIPEKNLQRPNMDQGRYRQNGYAALMELNALQAGRWSPQDVTGSGEATTVYNDKVKGVANGLTLYSNVNENGLTVDSLTELPKIVSDYLFARIFFVNDEDQINSNLIRAYNNENKDSFAIEFDEVAEPGKTVNARTKKINSFGIKRVIYPELRVLKHITYTVGESILNQFKYNNWRDNQGFVDEECNKDYRNLYLNSDNLQKWMLDFAHLTLEQKVLEDDQDYPPFKEFWHDIAVGRAEEAKKADCPLNELDNIMGEFFQYHFREKGVEGFYSGKERAIPDIAKEIRHKVETELYDKWEDGQVSIAELQKVSKLLLEKIDEILTDLETKSRKENEYIDTYDLDKTENVTEWSRLGVIPRMIGKGARRYAEHQEILTDYYTSRTMHVAWEFAKKLAVKLQRELITMNTDISSFGQKINDAIAETEKLVVAQRKINKGLEDMKGVIIEVSEEETMTNFEVELKTSKDDMTVLATQIRKAILPNSGGFINFGRLAADISIDEIKDAFDVKLSEAVKTKHNEKVENDKKVLGLNILTQLRQKLKTDEDIKEFAAKIVRQSGVFLKLDNDQMQLHLRNNEGELSPSNPASINMKEILVSIPAPDDDLNIKFADKLADAIDKSIPQGNANITPMVNRANPRKNELSILAVSYCYPMRAIDWLKDYKKLYETSLNTGNPATDANNAILLHSEGTGKEFPSLFAVDNVEEFLAQSQPVANATTPPSMPGAVPPPIMSTPQVNLFIAIGGQQYGPYNFDQCKQMTVSGQLTPQSMVWMEGLSSWTIASKVPMLAPLFAPASPTNMPPLPPQGGPTPPPIM